jgi:hypothetical protein
MIDLNNQTTEASANAISEKLNEQLKAFQTPTIKAEVRPNPMASPAQPQQEVEEQEEQEDQEDQEQIEAPEEQEQEETPDSFVQAFENYFGLKPNEALETVNQLVAFKDEMTLMRSWGVTPVEYDQRMEAIKSFYQTLPEEGREQFNSVEGAMAIWDHLIKTGQTTPTMAKPPTASAFSRTKPSSSKPKLDIIKKSEILRMDKATYQANLPRITKAFQEGRVIDDV